MPTDDIHDLFDSEEADEPDESTEGSDEATDEPDPSVAGDERQSTEDEGLRDTSDPTRDGIDASSATPFEVPAEDDGSGRARTTSTTSPGGSFEGDAEGTEPVEPTAFPGEGAENGSGASESTEPDTHDDEGGLEPSTTSTFEAATEDDGEQFETGDLGDPAPTGPSGPDSDDTGEFETPLTPVEEGVDSTRERTGTSTTESPEDAATDDVDEFESPTGSSGRIAQTDADDSASSDAFHPTSEPAIGDREEQESASGTEPDPVASEGVAEPDVDEDGSAGETSAPAEVPAGEHEESGPDGAGASTEATVSEAQDASESAGPTTSGAGAIQEDPDQSPTEDLDEPETGAGEAAVGGGRSTATSESNRLPTGIDVLDRAMGGGVPPGRLVLLVADPGVQSELIVDSVLSQRDTLYVTTDRPDWEVMRDIEPGLGSGEVMIRDHTPDTLLSGVDLLLDELGTSSNFVLDSVNELELLPRQRYRIFLSDVKRRLFETGSIGLLTGVTVGHESARDLTLRRADIVWQLETRTTDREIENRLSVPKFRGGAAMTETVKLKLTDEVRVDTGWNDE